MDTNITNNKGDPQKDNPLTSFSLGLFFVIIAILAFYFIGSISKAIKTSNALDRCNIASEEQMDFIDYAVNTKQQSNSIKTAWSVKSNDFENVYIVSAYVIGPGLDNQDDPAVFSVGGDPSTPGIFMSVNYMAKAMTDFPDAGRSDAMIDDSADGVKESILCAKHYQ